MKKIIECPLLGLPLLYIGVVLMSVHFLFGINSNLLLVIALLLEITGVALHLYKIRH